MTADVRTVVSVVIKAFNEEQRIAACVESALSALDEAAPDGVAGEVVLADSHSTDETVAIAAAYPIIVVQIAHPQERRCGVGPQLGFQVARGDWIYFLDGDMELQPGFLAVAVETLKADPGLAGVGGLVSETSRASMQFRRRRSRNLEGTAGGARWLGMGGLYRAAALRSVGYASDRNLYAYEEQDLGLRLKARGWRLRRIPVPAILHHGHRDHTLTLMRKRWRSGYLFGPGQILRASFGRSWFGAVLWGQRHLLATLCLWALLLSGLVAARFSLIPLAVWLAVMGILTLERIVRLRSLTDGLLSVLVWHVNAIALLCGLFLPQVDPRLHLEAQVLSRKRS